MMNKPIFGLILGGILGIFDGLSALITSPDVPEVKDGIIGIVIGSTFKGLIVGIASGYFAKKLNSLPLGMAFGLILGAALALIVAIMQGSHYLEIILPGAIAGLIVGFATQKYGANVCRPA